MKSVFGWTVIKDRDLKALTAQSIQKQEIIKEQDQHIANFEQRANELLRDVEHWKAESHIFQAQVADLKAQCAGQSSVIQDGLNDKRLLHQEIQRLQVELASAKLAVTESTRTINGLRQQLWGVPESLPRGVAELVDFAAMGLPEPVK